MSKKSRRRGKELERFIAADLGGRRLGILGKEDVRYKNYVIECKERKELPRMLKKGIEQALKNCGEGDIPVFIQHELHQPHDLDLVTMYYLDWKKLALGDLNKSRKEGGHNE